MPVLDRAGQRAGGRARRGARRERRRRRCRAARYGAEDFAAPPAAQDPAALAAREVAATRAYLRFATDLSKGVLTPSAVVEDITRKPARAGARPRCSPRSRRRRWPEALQGFEPQDPDYRRLMAEKARLEAHGRSRRLGPGGRRGADAASGRRAARGWPSCGRGWRGSATSRRRPRWPAPGFDDGLTQAVAQFQRDYGLNDDGVVGRDDARGDERADRDAAGAGGGQPRADALDERRPGAALPRRQHPRLHRDALRGRRAGLDTRRWWWARPT